MNRFQTILVAAARLATTVTARMQTVVIGAGFVTSGPFAPYGSDARAGMNVAVAEINAPLAEHGLDVLGVPERSFAG